MSSEVWLPVKNYEGLYEVSNLGRVKSLETRNKRTSESKRNKSQNILQFDGNKLIGKYGSLIEIEEKNNFKYQAISNCIKGKTKTAYGYVWKYEKVVDV